MLKCESKQKNKELIIYTRKTFMSVEATHHPREQEHDPSLNQEEQQILNAVELFESMRNPEELRTLRGSVAEHSDKEVYDSIKQLCMDKITSMGDGSLLKDVNQLEAKYGTGIISHMRNEYLDYVTMPDEQFEQEISDVENDAQQMHETGSTNKFKQIIQSDGAQQAFAEGGEEAYQNYVKDQLSWSREYDGPVAKGMEIELAPSHELVSVGTDTDEREDPKDEDRYDNMVQRITASGAKSVRRIDENGKEKVVKAADILAAFGHSEAEANDNLKLKDSQAEEPMGQSQESESSKESSVDDSEHADENAEESQEKQGKFKRFRDNLRARTNMLVFSAREKLTGSEATKNDAAIIGLAALAAAGVAVAWLHNKGIILSDGGEANGAIPGAGETGPGVVEGGVNGVTPEVDVTPEMTTVHVVEGGGTSHIAKNTLGIDFATVEQWGEFNTMTNHLFEGVDGTYFDKASGEWRISNPGSFEIPQEILDEMQRAAEEIKTSR
jgi:hypothetical protein